MYTVGYVCILLCVKKPRRRHGIKKIKLFTVRHSWKYVAFVNTVCEHNTTPCPDISKNVYNRVSRVASHVVLVLPSVHWLRTIPAARGESVVFNGELKQRVEIENASYAFFLLLISKMRNVPFVLNDTCI